MLFQISACDPGYYNFPTCNKGKAYAILKKHTMESRDALEIQYMPKSGGIAPPQCVLYF